MRKTKFQFKYKTKIYNNIRIMNKSIGKINLKLIKITVEREKKRL